MVSKFEQHIDIKFSTTALEALSKHCSLSNTEIKQAINKGALWLSQGKSTKRLRRIKQVIPENSTLHFYYDASILAQQITAPTLIQDFKDYSVWYKPYGVYCQGSKWGDHCTINRWIETNITPHRPCFIVHRLDRAATGLIIIAHRKKTAQYFSQLFENHGLTKQYEILVHGDFSQHVNPTIITSPVDGKNAYSEFNFQQYNPVKQQSLITVNIKTGRKHQIRVHANSIGFPVVGDRLHPNFSSNQGEMINMSKEKKIPNLQLCAKLLTFICPVSGNEETITLPPQFNLSNNEFC